METPPESKSPSMVASSMEGDADDPGSNTSVEPLQDSDEFPLNQPDSRTPPLRIARSISQLDSETGARVGELVAAHLEGVHLGINLPSDMPRERKLKLLKAEALWRAGVQSAKEIADEIGVEHTTLYAYAKTYHWPKRDDLAKLSNEAVKTANILAISMRAKDARERLRAARASGAEKQAAAWDSDEENRPQPGISDLGAERDARPMSDQDAQRAVVVEQATAAAVQDAITSMYVESISTILDAQQQLASKLVAHVRELVDALVGAWEAEKVNQGKKVTPKEVRAAVAAQVAIMKQLITMAAQSVVLERRVWMLDAGDGAGGSTAPGDEGGVPVPTQRGTYDDFVRQAEAGGTKLTR